MLFNDLLSFMLNFQLFYAELFSHVASSCDQREIVSFLLDRGVDASLRDSGGLTAQEAASDSDTRALFSSST